MDAGFQLWPHQQAAIREFGSHLRAGRQRVLVSLPTGGGKSEVAAALAKMCNEQGKKVLFAAPKIVLIEQVIDVFANRFGLPKQEFGVLQGANTRRLHAPYVIATPQTIQSRGLPPDVRLVVIDECHTQYRGLYHALRQLDHQPTVLGLTATPYSKGLAEHWDALVSTTTTDALCESGELVPVHAYAARFRVNTDGLKVNKANGDYGSARDIEDRTTAQVLDSASARWAQTCEREFGGPVPTIVFSRSIDQGRLLVDEFQRKGYDFRQVHSGDDQDTRRRHIADFRNGQCIGLVSVAVLAEGFDVRDVRCVLNARPTVSLTRLVQIIGRGQRSCEGKSHCVVIDMTESIETAMPDLHRHWAQGPTKLEPPAKHKGNGIAPTKACPECGAIVALGTKQCPTCEYEWPANVVEVEEGDLELLARPDYSHRPYDTLFTELYGLIAEKGRGWTWSLVCGLAEAQAGRDDPGLYRMACAKWITWENAGMLDAIPGGKWHNKQIPCKRYNSKQLALAKAFDEAAWARLRASHDRIELASALRLGQATNGRAPLLPPPPVNTAQNNPLTIQP